VEVDRTPPATSRARPRSSAEVDVGFLLAVFAQAPVGVARLVLDLRGAVARHRRVLRHRRGRSCRRTCAALGIAGLTVLAPGALLAPRRVAVRAPHLAAAGVEDGGLEP
jgi:hypothetical protein